MSSSSTPKKKAKKNEVFLVAPLNSEPYIGPLIGESSSSMASVGSNNNTATREHSVVYQRVESTEGVKDLAAQRKTIVSLSGSAAVGKNVPTIGHVDIFESEESFFFRVWLPGVSEDENEFSCEIDADGKVLIKGVTRTGEKIVCRYSQVFTMLTQNLCPPGHFTISVQFSGPVKNEEFTCKLSNGVLEGHVKRAM